MHSVFSQCFASGTSCRTCKQYSQSRELFTSDLYLSCFLNLQSIPVLLCMDWYVSWLYRHSILRKLMCCFISYLHCKSDEPNKKREEWLSCTYCKRPLVTSLRILHYFGLKNVACVVCYARSFYGRQVNTFFVMLNVTAPPQGKTNRMTQCPRLRQSNPRSI